MFGKVSHVGWVAVITLVVVVAAIVASRKTKHIIEFADGTTAEIKRASAN